MTGRPPFTGTTTAIMWSHLHDPPPPMREQRSDIPLQADQVMARALAKDAGDRYTTCREFSQGLARSFQPATSDVVAGRPGEAAAPDRAAARSFGRRRAPRRRVLLAGCLC